MELIMKENPLKKQRLEWLDAMRGFTMILVVMFHVTAISFGQEDSESASTSFLILFRIPLFFFFSGYLAYKADLEWNTENYVTILWKKVKIQILPTVVFFMLMCAIRCDDFTFAFFTFLSTPTKGGYWFTWSLLHMFFLYYTVLFGYNRLLKYANGGGKMENLILCFIFLVFVCIYMMLYMPSVFSFKHPFWGYFSFTQTMKFFQFFLIGNLTHRYWKKFEFLFDSKYFFPLVSVIATVCTLECLKLHHFLQSIEHLVRLAAIYSLMFIVIMFFRFYKDSFSKTTWIGANLQKIGTRTLDIYLIHFILLPSLPCVGTFFADNKANFLIEIVASLAISIIVIIGCFIVSNILRISPIFKRYLFGR